MDFLDRHRSVRYYHDTSCGLFNLNCIIRVLYLVLLKLIDAFTITICCLPVHLGNYVRSSFFSPYICGQSSVTVTYCRDYDAIIAAYYLLRLRRVDFVVTQHYIFG